MVTPVRSGSRGRRGRDSVHTDEAPAETGDRAAAPPHSREPRRERLRASAPAQAPQPPTDGSPTRQPTTDHAPTVRSPPTEATEGRGYGNPGSEPQPMEARAR